MKKQISLLVLIAFTFVGCAGSGTGGTGGSTGHPAPYTVSGTVQDNVYPGASRQLYAAVDSDTTIGNGNINSSAALATVSTGFSLGNIPAAGTYYVYGWKDIDSNGVFSSGDSYTSTPVQVVITNDDIVLSSPVVLDATL